MEPCLDCHEDYPIGDLAFGLCPDCKDGIDGLDAEDALDKAMAMVPHPHTAVAAQNEQAAYSTLTDEDIDATTI